MAPLVGASDAPGRGGARWKLSRRIRPLSPYSARRCCSSPPDSARSSLSGNARRRSRRDVAGAVPRGPCRYCPLSGTLSAGGRNELPLASGCSTVGKSSVPERRRSPTGSTGRTSRSASNGAPPAQPNTNEGNASGNELGSSRATTDTGYVLARHSGLEPETPSLPFDGRGNQSQPGATDWLVLAVSAAERFATGCH
jgi:hypothetical protein